MDAALVDCFRRGAGLPRCTLQQVMLRVKDAQRSLAFYRDVLGMTEIDRYTFDKWSFSLHFLATLPPNTAYDLEPGTPEAHKFLWSYPGVVLELTYNHGTEKDENFKYHPGNTPLDAFSHIGFAVPDVEKACVDLENAGVVVTNKSATRSSVVDPDGYTLHLVPRVKSDAIDDTRFLLSEVGLLVVNSPSSAAFYQKFFDLSLISTEENDESTTYYLATVPLLKDKNFSLETLRSSNVPVVALRELKVKDTDKAKKAGEGFKYRNGNVEPFRGFGHTGFLVEDVYKFSEHLENKGVKFQKKPDEGGMKGLAFALDVDGYWIEIIKRGQDGKF